MKCWRYKLDHDYGFAPNPFWGIMTLATCKEQLRKSSNLQIGDWIVGLGSKSMGNIGHMIYAMKVEQIITFDEYWNNPIYACKRPVTNGTLCQMYGDNVYHTDQRTGNMIQEHCAHSISSNEPNMGHYKSDISGKNVILSKEFYYFGDHCPLLPKEYNYISNIHNRGNRQYSDLSEEQVKSFVSWLESKYTVGIHGDPCNWKEFNLPKLDIYDDGIE